MSMVENMRITLPYTERDYSSLDESLDDLLKSLTLKHDHTKSITRSVSFNGRDSEPVSKDQGSKKFILNGSLSFNKTKKIVQEKSNSNKLSRFAPSPKNNNIQPPSDSPKHVAAVKLQKVYKSFRIRRQLADCAVLVEQRWWKLLDFAMLKQSSVSFFELKKTESVVAKWARAKSRAAKVGKGLSKDVKARKLALQHWLEAIDPRHRYGHNLHFYYDCWLRCESRQPFFYWLDVGEGKEVSMDEKCPRSKLQHQCIKYLGPKEREVYEVLIEDGRFMYKKSEVVLDSTNEESKDSKWIFVLSTSKVLYVGQKKKGTFQHSSFLAGGATSAAGRLEVENGVLKAIWPHSGHYRPTEENFQEFVAFLKSKNVDLTNVKKNSIEDEEEPCKLRPSRSELDLTLIKPAEVIENNTIEVKSHKRSKSYDPSPDIEEMERVRTKKMMMYDSDESDEDESEEEENKNRTLNGDEETEAASRTSDYKFRKPNLFEEQDEEEAIAVPSELILRRMKFRKERLSLQLGRQLSCKWTTGAGPRIGCVGDCPSELRIRALEQVHLSPKSSEPKGWPSPKSVPSPIPRENTRV